MKVVILAGGFGTRLSEYSGSIPKPLVPIGGKPIIWHIMQHYASYGHKDFYIALGYKSESIKEYFLNYRTLSSNFTLDLGSGEVTLHQHDALDWRVTLVETGLKTLTGGRVKLLKPFIGDQTFLLTYGDGVANIDLDGLVKFHKSHGKLVTITAVRPTARFGELEINANRVIRFEEKPQLEEGWVNGGFMVIEPKFFDFIEGDQTMIEREPMEKAASLEELMAFCHQGFWQCMDTKRDHDILEKLWTTSAPWTK